MSEIPNAREVFLEKLARRMAVRLGHDPDELVTIGYGDHEQTGPYWKMQREWAIRIWAALEVFEEEDAI